MCIAAYQFDGKWQARHGTEINFVWKFVSELASIDYPVSMN